MKLARVALKDVIAVAALAAAAVLGYFAVKSAVPPEAFRSPESLREYIAGFGVLAPIVFFAFQVLQIIFSFIPGAVTALAGGALFGFWGGFFLTVAALVCGSALVFVAARLFGRRLVERLIGKEKVEKYLDTVGKSQHLTFFMIMLLPFFPDDIICLVAGLTSIKFRHFLLMVLAGRPWGALFASLIGSGAFKVPIWGWAIIGIGTICAMYLSIRYGQAIEQKALAILKGRRPSASKTSAN